MIIVHQKHDFCGLIGDVYVFCVSSIGSWYEKGYFTCLPLL